MNKSGTQKRTVSKKGRRFVGIFPKYKLIDKEEELHMSSIDPMLQTIFSEKETLKLISLYTSKSRINFVP